jgi:hypothetical protein
MPKKTTKRKIVPKKVKSTFLYKVLTGLSKIFGKGY